MRDEDSDTAKRIDSLLAQMNANDVTPHSAKPRAYARQKRALETGSALLRAKGHVEIADYMDAEIARTASIPSIDTNVTSHVEALLAQVRLALTVHQYCKKHPDAADVLPYMSFGSKNNKPLGT